jgi:hypothetical protein
MSFLLALLSLATVLFGFSTALSILTSSGILIPVPIDAVWRLLASD